ncbi:MAG: hypothetical protein ACM3SQ_10260 [Betaproteobacteria bacterium]
MDQQQEARRRSWAKWIDITQSASIIALALSLLSFYRSYFYVNQKLAVTVTEVSYGTNRGELYMTVAFSNAGNRDAAVLRVEPAEHPVARLLIDKRGRIVGADPAIHRTLSGFSDLHTAPPGDSLTANKQTPFVWASEDYR